ncbi:helix-hairpin-helix domain-containing protein [Rhizobium sp. SL86]|uniref:helix-hairpin-helix domain-containing protein n=1 Tax=Rhizobium sp. SL86 TaxID=2995148 RepID=UPI002272BFD7|nr:helix-hairpin-helix domain-containing protein [Rhizobium sp. SL86]MCY1664229.1 helix-hairpin-helix domain-containing protein [Rhizobium sp. SL86]
MPANRASPKPRRRSETGSPPASDLLNQSRLPPWIVKALKANRIRRLSQLAGLSDRDLLQLDGIGQRSLELIRAEIARGRGGGPAAEGEGTGLPAP